MIHKIWYFHMVIQAWSRSKCTWWISWSEEEVLRRQRRPTCRTPNPSFLKSTSFFSVKAITRFFFDWISPKFEDKKSRTTARESSAEKGSKSSSDASGPVDDRGHSCKRFTRTLSAVALSTWNLSCSLKEFQTVAGALLEYYMSIIVALSKWDSSCSTKKSFKPGGRDVDQVLQTLQL